MNAKLAKACRRVIREQSAPGTKRSELRAKPVRTVRGTRYIAVQARHVDRGAYLALKKRVAADPAARRQILETSRYLVLLREQQRAGGPKLA